MKKKEFNTPILFLVFNRPEQTKRVLEQIRKIKPAKLYISADGPRNNNSDDIKNCIEVRDIVEQIDWECELKTNYLTKNKGCKIAVSSGITWFFNNVEEGIILEDDCLPSISFFNFCNELLERYRFDTRIGSITGYNYLNSTNTDTSYFFSNIGEIWGWATWRRVWTNYDVKINSWEAIESKKAVENIFNNKLLSGFFNYKFTLTYYNQINTWDYQFYLLKLLNNWLTVVPSKNLIKNIGFDQHATHTSNVSNFETNNSYEIRDGLIHPVIFSPNRKYDFSYLRKHINFKSVFNFFINKIKQAKK